MTEDSRIDNPMTKIMTEALNRIEKEYGLQIKHMDIHWIDATNIRDQRKRAHVLNIDMEGVLL